MAKALKVLQRIKKTELDDLRRNLAAKLDKQEAIEQELRKLTEEYEAEKDFATQNPMVGNFGLYTEVYLQKKTIMEDYIAKLEKEIEQLRITITDIFREQKTYSIIDERREKNKIKEADLVEQRTLDEIGTNAYIKKHKN